MTCGVLKSKSVKGFVLTHEECIYFSFCCNTLLELDPDGLVWNHPKSQK